MEHLAKAIKLLRKIGIDGIIIGSTCIYLELNERRLEGDIDLFVTSLSPLVEEEKIRRIAYENGWSIGITELGTPSIIINIDGIDITIELYENILDFYIPYDAIELCKRRKIIANEEVDYIAPECWIILKAKRGSNQDIDELLMIRNFIERNELKLNQTLLNSTINLFSDEASYIRNRLKSINIL